MADKTIIARFSPDSGQWVAHFENAPQVAFGGDLPVVAIRRLLDGAEAAPGTYPLACDADRAGSSVLLRAVIWQPPEVLFQCPSCEGRGEYVGFMEREKCKACGGRGLVPG